MAPRAASVDGLLLAYLLMWNCKARPCGRI
jgi:hypothetical protein